MVVVKLLQYKLLFIIVLVNGEARFSFLEFKFVKLLLQNSYPVLHCSYIIDDLVTFTS